MRQSRRLTLRAPHRRSPCVLRTTIVSFEGDVSEGCDTNIEGQSLAETAAGIYLIGRETTGRRWTKRLRPLSPIPTTLTASGCPAPVALAAALRKRVVADLGAIRQAAASRSPSSR